MQASSAFTTTATVAYQKKRNKNNKKINRLKNVYNRLVSTNIYMVNMTNDGEKKNNKKAVPGSFIVFCSGCYAQTTKKN